MRVHVIGLHHTIPDERFSHCAFTGKVQRFPLVCPYPVVSYVNGPAAPDRVSILSEAKLRKRFGAKLFTHTTVENNGNQENRGEFLDKAMAKMASRVKPGDIVAHVYEPLQRFVAALPQAIHVETGIGYATGPAGCYRIFESESWRAWHMGRYHLTNNGGGGTWPDYPELVSTAVVPNYYDPTQWPLGDGLGTRGRPYVLFVGRMTSDKGIEVVEYLARAFPEITFKIVSGEPRSDRLTAPNIDWIGLVQSRSVLAVLYGSALCTIAPSRFWEPFGGVAVESLLTGTPVICPDYAAFVETVAHPDDGLRCMTPEDYRYALALMLNPEEGWASHAGRETRRARAQERFGIDRGRVLYEAAFEHFRRLHGAGVRP